MQLEMDSYVLRCNILRNLRIAIKFGGLTTSHKACCETLVRFLSALDSLMEKLQDIEMQDSEDKLKQLEIAVLKAKRLLCECHTRSRVYMILKSEACIPKFSEISRDLAIQVNAIAKLCSRYQGEMGALCADMRAQSFEVHEMDRELSEDIIAILNLQNAGQPVSPRVLLELARALDLQDDSAIVLEQSRLEDDMEDARAEEDQKEVQFIFEVLSMLASMKAASLAPQPVQGGIASPTRDPPARLVDSGSVERYSHPQEESGPCAGAAADAVASSDDGGAESPLVDEAGARAGWQSEHRNLLSAGMPAPPENFLCPLSGEVMMEPVTVSTGVAYERASIQHHLDEGHRTCPRTGERLMHTNLIPNSTLKGKIASWFDEHHLLPPQPGSSTLTSPGADSSLQGIPGGIPDSSLGAWASASANPPLHDDSVAASASSSLLQSQGSKSFFPPMFRPPSHIGLSLRASGSPGNATEPGGQIQAPDDPMRRLNLDEGEEGQNGWIPGRDAMSLAEERLPGGSLTVDVGSVNDNWGVVGAIPVEDDSSEASPTSTMSSSTPSPLAVPAQPRTFPVRRPQPPSTGGTPTRAAPTAGPVTHRLTPGQSRRTFRPSLSRGGDEAGAERARPLTAEERGRPSTAEGGSAWAEHSASERGRGLNQTSWGYNRGAMHGIAEAGSRSPGNSHHAEPRPQPRSQGDAQTPDRRNSYEDPRAYSSAPSRSQNRGDWQAGRPAATSPTDSEAADVRGFSEHPMAPQPVDNSTEEGPFTDPYLGEYVGEYVDFGPEVQAAPREEPQQEPRERESRRGMEANHRQPQRQLSGVSMASTSSLSLLHQGRGESAEFGGLEVARLVELLYSASVEDQRMAAGQLRLLSRSNNDNRIVIAAAGGIKPLVALLGTSDAATVEEAVTALLNLSIHDDNKKTIVDAGAIDSLKHVLETGNLDARKNAAATLFSLSVVDDHKVMIGDSGAIPPLVRLLEDGSPRGKKDAATALFNLSIYNGNKKKIIRAGAVKELVSLINDPTLGMVDKAVALLANLATIPEGQEVIGDEEGIPALVEVLELGSPKGKENAAAALLQLCKNSREHLQMVLQEGVIPPLVGLSQSGTARARQKASELLTLFREQRGQRSSVRSA